MPLYFQSLFYTASLAFTLFAKLRINFDLSQFSFADYFLPQFECSLYAPYTTQEMFVDFPVGICEVGFLVVYLTNQRVLSPLGSY